MKQESENDSKKTAKKRSNKPTDKSAKTQSKTRRRPKRSGKSNNNAVKADRPAPQTHSLADMPMASAESVEKFAALGLEGTVLQALRKMNWTEPSEIQQGLIPPALEGCDVLGQARTGTGKTAAFALPVLQLLEKNPIAAVAAAAKSEDSDKSGDSHKTSPPPVRCLVLAPTRELAAQVAEEMKRMGCDTGQKITMAYGGTRMRTQVMELKQHPSIVVGTPGRVMDLMERKLLHLDKLEFAILDEVDRMLDIGFRDDIRKILSRATGPHQTIFVSATIDDQIKRLAMQYMHQPKEIFLAPDKKTVDEIDQYYFSVQPEDKKRLLGELLIQEKPSLAIVFTRTKRETTKVARYLVDKGIEARDIHGDLMQSKREKIMKRFREGKIHVLVATDLASRGIDIDDISHIVNYDIPDDPEAYVHRVGRTGRMGSRGKAYVFVTREQGNELTNIEMFINREISPAKLDGFKFSATAPKARTVSDDEAASSRPAKLPSRLTEKTDDAGKDTAANRPRRTLGSKFPPRRRRR